MCVWGGGVPGEFLSADAYLNGKTQICAPIFIHTTVQIIPKCF